MAGLNSKLDLAFARNLFLNLGQRTRVLPVVLLVVALWLLLFRSGERRPALASVAVKQLQPRHPVELLHARAVADFEALLERQSKTPQAAEEEYKRRYGRAPPPGFTQWAQYAIAARSPIIDDFDIINDDLATFYGMRPKRIVDLMKKALKLPIPKENEHPLLPVICEFKDGKFKTEGQCRKDWFGVIQDALGSMAKNIPDVLVMGNYLAEPAVLVTTDNPHKMKWDFRVARSIAPEVKQACSFRSSHSLSTGSDAAPPAGHNRPRSQPKRKPIETYGIPFVQDLDDAKDVCKHPELTTQHGVYVSPASALHLNYRVPIFSMGKPAPFGDIVIPSPQYLWEWNEYDPGSDVGWPAKIRGVYWSGSSTGSWSTKDERTWRNSHRQRLVAAFDGQKRPDAPPRNYTYLQRTPYTGLFKPYSSSQLDQDLYHVRFGKMTQCEKVACEAQRNYFKTTGEDPKDMPFDYRYLFDVDGNGYTNRFYRLLGADNVVLKMGLWREWHDERLIPWVHYVPISMGLNEVPELVRFLATTEEGDRISRSIARAGSEWHDRALTAKHQGIYMYRLLLELAWLQNPSRVPEAMDSDDGEW